MYRHASAASDDGAVAAAAAAEAAAVAAAAAAAAEECSGIASAEANCIQSLDNVVTHLHNQ